MTRVAPPSDDGILRLFLLCEKYRINLKEAVVLLEIQGSDGSFWHGETAKKLGIGAPRLTRSLDKLVEQQLIYRTRDADDGRRIALTVLEHGQKFIKAFQAIPAFKRT